MSWNPRRFLLLIPLLDPRSDLWLTVGLYLLLWFIVDSLKIIPLPFDRRARGAAGVDFVVVGYLKRFESGIGGFHALISRNSRIVKESRGDYVSLS